MTLVAPTDHTSCLPLELLQAVLSSFDHSDVWNTSRVNQRWRTAAASHDLFFLSLDVELSSSTCPNISHDAVNKWVEHAALQAAAAGNCCPLRVRAHMARALGTDIGTTPEELVAIRRIMDTVATAMPVVKVLSLEFLASEMFIPAFQALRLAQAPLLYKLVIKPVSLFRDNQTSLKLPDMLFGDYSPRLRRLELWEIELPMRCPAALSAACDVSIFMAAVPPLDLLCASFPALKTLSVLHANLLGDSPSMPTRPRRVVRFRNLHLRSIQNYDWLQRFIGSADLSTVPSLLLGVRFESLPVSPVDVRSLLYTTQYPKMMRVHFGLTQQNVPLEFRYDDERTRTIDLEVGAKPTRERVLSIFDFSSIGTALITLDIPGHTLSSIGFPVGELPALSILKISMAYDAMRLECLPPCHCPALRTVEVYSFILTDRQPKPVVVDGPELQLLAVKTGQLLRPEPQRPELLLSRILVTNPQQMLEGQGYSSVIYAGGSILP
ncbi:hypothetical protein BKA62DRAFT_719399 [Auriculariales sp. MPI-PUGE-AT-0066]|nr:hypothetical protein BKA62DRAFT_719399 [Auriculariales sp. MPI-PUGE-AT-0066]